MDGEAGAGSGGEAEAGVRWRVSHLRAGAAVVLVELEADGPGGAEGEGDWVSAAPHPCGEDAYELVVRAGEDGGVVLVWTVRGPRKAEVLETVYRAAEGANEAGA